MALSAGTRLGPYEILSALGAGGMGEVYKARDTRLDRTVAIKILPSADPELKVRFEREAKAIAAFQHPNICTLHDVGHQDGIDYLVLEYLEGETLAQRMQRGPLQLGTALKIASEIADALDKAHRAGVVHRDLKPPNVMLSKSGVKVLDFGLAKLRPKSAAVSGFSMAVTAATPPITEGGTILGTLQYMSPEQIEGAEADARSDIFALGVVLYEMLTGIPAFTGNTPASVIGSILKDQPPPVSSLQPVTPRAVDEIVRRCLAKDPDDRWQSAADLKGVFGLIAESPPAVGRTGSRVRWRSIAVVAALLAAAALLAMWRVRSPGTVEMISFAVYPPEKTGFTGALNNTTVPVPHFAVSPDGRTLAFTAGAVGAKPLLWVRSMDKVAAQPLGGTDGAQYPFWSPDGHWLAFYSDGYLKRVAASGGPVQVVAQTAADFRGGSWGADDAILFATGRDAIRRVPSGGGTPTAFAIPDTARQDWSYRYPQFLPDGQHVLYTVLSSAEGGVYASSVDGKTKNHLLRLWTGAVYAPPGYLLFVEGDTLLGQVFDAQRLALSGQPFLVAEHVGLSTAFEAAVSVSRAGVLAYAGTLSQVGRLTWFDRTGNPLGSVGAENDYADFRLSPNERSLTASRFDSKTGTMDIWITDLERTSTSRLTVAGRIGGGSDDTIRAFLNASSIWSPGGTRLIFRSNRNGTVEFYDKSAAGGGNEGPIFLADAQVAAGIESQQLIPTDWSPDGTQMLFSVGTQASGFDLWLLPLTGDRKPMKLLASPSDEMHGTFSPDGHLVAYTSNESGRFQVYAQTLPLSDRKWQVSTDGGYEPRWRADGHEIYYLSDDRKLMAVSVGTGPSFATPKALFQTQVPAGVTAPRTHYVPSRDGRRFLVNSQIGDMSTTPITMVLNWTVALKK
jgi:Tol biopolymer transport system component